MKRGLSSSPQSISPLMWYYEEWKGLTVVKQIRIDGKYIRTDMDTIPWKMVLKSVERYKNRKEQA